MGAGRSREHGTVAVCCSQERGRSRAGTGRRAADGARSAGWAAERVSDGEPSAGAGARRTGGVGNWAVAAWWFAPREDVVLQNEAPTDFYILVTGSVVKHSFHDSLVLNHLCSFRNWSQFVVI